LNSRKISKRPSGRKPTHTESPPAGYVRDVLERDLVAAVGTASGDAPFKTGRGVFAKYGQAPSAEEMDANRNDMFRNFGEDS
jgi:hypothetical protein